MSRRQLIPTMLLLMCPCAVPALAQTAPPPSTFTLGDGIVDLAVPESPAFSALGVTPDQVGRPTTPRELATAFLNGVDRNGNLQTGVAFDAAPYMLLAGPGITLEDYRTGAYLTRFLTRWQASFATTKGGGEGDPSARLALGMRFSLFDQGDPRMDPVLVECLAREGNRVLTSAKPIPPFATEEEQAVLLRQREEETRVAVKPCREAAAKRRWNRSAWIAGVGPTWTSADGSTDQLSYSGTAVWTSLGYGFERVPVLEDRAMLAFYLKRRTREPAPDVFNDGAFVTQDTLATGVRVLIGAAFSQFNLEFLLIDNDRPDGREDCYWNLGIGFEQRLVDNTWLNLSFGRQLARDASGQLSVMGAFNWGLGARQ